MSEELRFDGQVGVVTGAAGGIGRAHALLLASRGARVLVNDAAVGTDGRPGSGASADEVCREIAAAGGEAVGDAHDVSSQADELIAHALSAFGRIDVLILNAGAGAGGPIATLSDEDFDRILEINLNGAMRVIRAAWPELVKTAGRVITTSSGSIFGTRYAHPYTASKSALIALTRGLAMEGRDHNVRVNGIMPVAHTRLMSNLGEADYEAFLSENFPPSEVAPFALWLAHEGVPFSGEMFSVGGGWAGRVSLAVAKGWGAPGSTPEDYADHADEILDLDGAVFPRDSGDEFLHRQERLLGHTFDVPALH